MALFATIFSWSNAPPPPFIKFKCGSNSSAPSKTKSSFPTSLRLANSIPNSLANSIVELDVGTPIISREFVLIILDNFLTNILAVDPVPNPIFIFFFTNFIAKSAAELFAISEFIYFFLPSQLHINLFGLLPS